MNWKRFVRKYSVRFGMYVLITAVLMTASVLIYNSKLTPYIYSNDSWDQIEPFVPTTNISYNILFDQHSHTYYSDGILSVEQNIRWHIAMGFNAGAITDHNNLKSSEEIAELTPKYQDQILIIQGME